MPRQRQAPPSPISIPLPPNLTSTSSSTTGIPLTSYLALPPPTATPNFFLRLKRSASQLRSSSPTPAFVPTLTPPVSPTPSSALLSPALFPLPPNRQDDDERPFANLAPRSPTTGSKPWLELPTSEPAPFQATSTAFTTRSEAKREESRWPLTPDSPYTPLKEPYSPNRHSPSRQGKSLVFPHKPRIASNVFPTFPSPKQRRSEAEEIDDDSDIDAPLSLAPASPRRHSTMNLPLLPSPPRSPVVRNGLLSPPEVAGPSTPQTPPPSRPRSMLAPSPPPTSALPPIPADNSLGLEVDPPATPPRSLRTTPRIAPSAPARPRRIFSDYPALSTVSPSKRVHFPNGPTSKRRPRTPFPPPSSAARPASISSYASSSSSSSSNGSDREDFDFSSSPKDSFETSDSSFSTNGSNRGIRVGSSSSSSSSSASPLRSKTTPSRPVTVHPPTMTVRPPRPPRSPLRPISRSTTPLPTLRLEPSAFEHGVHDDDEDELIRPRANRFLSTATAAGSSSSSANNRRLSTYSLGTVDSREYYELMGFDRRRYGVVAGMIRGVEPNPKLVVDRKNRTRLENGGDEERNVVELGGLTEDVRESFMRMRFQDGSEGVERDDVEGDDEDDEEEVLQVTRKFVASGSQDSLDDSFVLEMTEKMLWSC